ncbi:MAG TPA: hypothetical protein VGO58_07835 [Chitinophagaceae bacterium]|jgi:hypothetical protein|nr:hypothetical protein [Chitinophagaceae bacterium]
MSEYQDREFYPTYLFLVSGFSFSLFALTLSLIGGQHRELFWWISGISFALGSLTGACVLIKRASRKKD